jgi:hypothetical protein
MKRWLVDADVARDVELLRRRVEAQLVGPEGNGKGNGNGNLLALLLSEGRSRHACEGREAQRSDRPSLQ